VQIEVLEATAARTQAAEAEHGGGGGDAGEAAQRLRQLAVACTRKDAALQEARATVGRLQRCVQLWFSSADKLEAGS